VPEALFAFGEAEVVQVRDGGVEIGNGLLVFAELLIRLAPLVVSVDSGTHLDGLAAILNGLLHVAILQIDLAARIVRPDSYEPASTR
jgi:hypothetical protein